MCSRDRRKILHEHAVFERRVFDDAVRADSNVTAENDISLQDDVHFDLDIRAEPKVAAHIDPRWIDHVQPLLRESKDILPARLALRPAIYVAHRFTSASSEACAAAS